MTNKCQSKHSSSALKFSFSSYLKCCPSPAVSLIDCIQYTYDRLEVFPGKMCSKNVSIQGWFTLASQMELILCLLLIYLACPTLATMEITALEYHRKFHKTLDLGECCQTQVAVNMGNNSFYIEDQKCTLYQRGTISHQPQEVHDSKNILIDSADKVVPYLGLCGGEAASFLGILNSGDCVAIEIASRLTFNDKTMVRAFIGNYQKSIDTLEAEGSNLEGMDKYYKDKLYLRCRSYGTMELLLVQFRFDSVLATQEAKKIKSSSLQMSSYMKQIQNRIGHPRSILVINLSTANQETYQIHQFQRADWERAVRYVEILELNIQRTKTQINTKNYPLVYRLQPFLEDKEYRLTAPALWEEISMLEVQLRQALNVAKTTAQKCRGNKAKLCRRVRELRRKLTTAQAEVHKGRANWVRLKPDDRGSFAAQYSANVQSYNSVTKNLAKSVREMKINASKPEKTTKKQNISNQIPWDNQESIHKLQSTGSLGRSRFRRRHRS